MFLYIEPGQWWCYRGLREENDQTGERLSQLATWELGANET